MILKNLTGHFRWWTVPYHNTRRQQAVKGDWNCSLFGLTMSLQSREWLTCFYSAFPTIRRMSQKMLALFGLACVREQKFRVISILSSSSQMKRNWPTPQINMRITTTKPAADFDKQWLQWRPCSTSVPTKIVLDSSGGSKGGPGWAMPPDFWLALCLAPQFCA